MAPVTNEILSGTSAQESLPQSAGTESKAPSLRSDAVSLDVAIKVHGTRAASGGDSQSERFEEQTTTMIVFPEGGVLRMATAVAPGQMLVLTNQKSRQDAICRVVKVRKFSNSQSYVEVEFTRPQPAYWGVYFASRHESDDEGARASHASPKTSPDTLATASLPAAPPEPAAPELIENIADLHPSSPATPPMPPASPAKTASPFASFGTREKIQPAASATATRGTPAKNPISVSSSENVPGDSAPPPVSGRVPAGSVANISSLPDLDELSTAAKAAPSGDIFGVRLDGKIGSTAAAPRQNWMLIAASIAALLAVAAGGAWYFHSKFAKPAGSAATSTEIVQQPAAPAAQPSSTPAIPPSGVAAVPANGTDTGSARVETENAGATRTAAEPAGSTENAEQPHVIAAPAAPATATGQNASNSVLASSGMTAHPLSSQHAINSPGDAPVLDVATGSSHEPGGLPSISSSGVALPPPPAAAPQKPVHVGGEIQQPKLIRSVVPVYPFAARQARIQGDVVIDTRIGPNGSVTSMKVISGPAMLRQAAIDALRRWKYQPSKLDGKPVAVQMLVTIRFRL